MHPIVFWRLSQKRYVSEVRRSIEVALWSRPASADLQKLLEMLPLPCPSPAQSSAKGYVPAFARFDRRLRYKRPTSNCHTRSSGLCARGGELRKQPQRRLPDIAL